MQCNLLQSRHKWCHGETEKNGAMSETDVGVRVSAGKK